MPDGWPKLPVLANHMGGMGSGKTHFAAQLIRAYVDTGSINRVFLVSPTYFTNAHLWSCGVDPEECFTEISQAPEPLKRSCGESNRITVPLCSSRNSRMRSRHIKWAASHIEAARSSGKQRL